MFCRHQRVDGISMLAGQIKKMEYLDFSDFNKKALSIRKDFIFNSKWSGYQTLQYINFYTQMTGSVDSINFANKDFSSLQSFTYRKINLIRWRQNLEYTLGKAIQNLWQTSCIVVIPWDQNPAYLIGSTNNPTQIQRTN